MQLKNLVQKTFKRIFLRTFPGLMFGCGYSHSVFLDETGNVWSCGDNGHGQLGLLDEELSDPAQILSLPKIKTIFCGNDISLFIDAEDGSVWGCGDNSFGQLGVYSSIELNDEQFKLSSIFIPEKIRGLSSIKSIALGRGFTIFIEESGSIWSCGKNFFPGELGRRTVSPPTKLQTLPKIHSISCGDFHLLLLDEQGVVWALGNNVAGQLGLGDTENHDFPVVVNLPRIQSTACGLDHSLFLDVDGCVWSCGDNFCDQLGLGDTNRSLIPQKVTHPTIEIQSVICGSRYSLCLDINGDVWACGENEDGQLGLGDTSARKFFEKIGNLPKIYAMAAGSRHTLLLDVNGAVWGCGTNIYGQIGNSNILEDWSLSPIRTIPSIRIPVPKTGMRTKSARNE